VWGCQPHIQPQTWRTRVSLFVWLLPLDPSGLGGPTSSYATATIALRVSGALKPHRHDKVGIASVRGKNHIIIYAEQKWSQSDLLTEVTGKAGMKPWGNIN
jgi:hypothetical protein